MPPWPQGCESHGPGALPSWRTGLVWKDTMVVVLVEEAVVGCGGVLVVGVSVVVLWLVKGHLEAVVGSMVLLADVVVVAIVGVAVATVVAVVVKNGRPEEPKRVIKRDRARERERRARK